MARIYIADLAAYNNGDLVGKWIDLDQFSDVEELEWEIKTHVLLDGHKEWAIHDHEGFGGLRISEHEDLDVMLELSEAVEKHGDPFVAWIGDIVGDISYFGSVSEAVDQFEDVYIGQMTIEDYAYEYAEEVLGLTGTALEYFDTEKFARDLEASGDVSEAWYDGEYYVFRAW
ncbi:ArdA-like antirestriction protein [Mycobacterium phage SydNat]|uniref:ArdA-like antirestriction protein n=1 Tax=Mycobacterium phage Zolita TaxID=2593355 RepID=A0A514U2H4_9CAUD|nr:anti-restriction protein [Mycobacterium phage Zolita]QDK03161.1 ArdA-like antirestriction protein [Mycobacterium phage Zolita]UVK64298.1 ArdA-like antirestriction protein [Mycobacterium phage SydNat]UVK64386.1 ArdA-like antirestriction protein [Mycobacterium phage Ghoulboy]